MAFQFAFAGDGFQDEGEFLAAFEHHAISVNEDSFIGDHFLQTRKELV